VEPVCGFHDEVGLHRFEQLAAAIQNSQAPRAMKAATKTIRTTSTSCAAAAAAATEN